MSGNKNGILKFTMSKRLLVPKVLEEEMDRMVDEFIVDDNPDTIKLLIKLLLITISSECMTCCTDNKSGQYGLDAIADCHEAACKWRHFDPKMFQRGREKLAAAGYTL